MGWRRRVLSELELLESSTGDVAVLGAKRRTDVLTLSRRIVRPPGLASLVEFAHVACTLWNSRNLSSSTAGTRTTLAIRTWRRPRESHRWTVRADTCMRSATCFTVNI